MGQPFRQALNFDTGVYYPWFSFPTFLEGEYEGKTGGQVLAIAHNGNLSNGLLFDDVTLSGDPLSQACAISRTRWELKLMK